MKQLINTQSCRTNVAYSPFLIYYYRTDAYTEGRFKVNKKLLGVCFVLLLCALLVGCGTCQHQWSDADCVNASICTLCGEVQGEALGHDWSEATCQSPETCSRCGETQGELQEHIWIEATCQSPETCNQCGETRGEPLSHSYGLWMLDTAEMYRVCVSCKQSESREIDYSLYLDQHIYGRWNLCGMVKNGRDVRYYMLPQNEADMEVCFYEDGRVFSLGFEEEEISPSWSFDHGEYDSESLQHYIYISFPESNILSSARFACFGDEISYEIPLDDEGDMVTLSNSFGDKVAAMLVGEWSSWSEGSFYNISFSEDRSFTADIDGEISGFWQPRSPEISSQSDGTVQIMLNYYKDGKSYSQYATLDGYSDTISQKQAINYLRLSTSVKDTHTSFGLDNKQFLTETLSTADKAHLGVWTSLDYIVSTPNPQTYSYDEEKGLSTEYSISFMEDGSFSAKLNQELEGQWSLREVRRDNIGACLVYRLKASGIDDYSYFQMYESGDAYLYVSYDDHVSCNYSLRQMSEEEITARNELVAAAPVKVVGEWFCIDGQDFKAVFNEDGTFTTSSETAPEWYNYTGYWYFNTIDNFQGNYTYYYDIETIMDIEESADAEASVENVDAAELADDAVDTLTNAEEEPMTYRENYAIRLYIKDELCTLELESLFVSGSMTSAEGLAIVEEANAALVGHWEATTATQYNTDNEDSQGSHS